MKICHITSVHIPFDTRIFYKECKSLKMAGYDVHLIAKNDKDEVIDGIHIHSVPERKSKLKRMMFTTWNVYQKALKIDAVVYHIHDPELIPFGLLLKLHGKKVIYDIHEDYPDYIQHKQYIPYLFRKSIALSTGKIENTFTKFFDVIITVAPKVTSRFEKLNKFTYEICNFPFLNEFSEGYMKKSWESRSDSVTYVGSITIDRSIKEMIEACGIVQKKK
ncbi:glycosyltransferase, partial [Candidatus Latescibacterota bacterium]